jgi:hypothetical protein
MTGYGERIRRDPTAKKGNTSAMSSKKPATNHQGSNPDRTKSEVPREQAVKDARAKARPGTGWPNEHKKKR